MEASGTLSTSSLFGCEQGLTLFISPPIFSLDPSFSCEVTIVIWLNHLPAACPNSELHLCSTGSSGFKYWF